MKWRTVAMTCMLGACSMCLAIPKGMLMQYMHSSRFLAFDGLEALAMMQQDLLLVLLTFCVLNTCLRRMRLSHLVLCFAATTVLLAVLLLDARVRELWLRPLDRSLIRFYLEFSSHLSSGTDIFFNHAAGWGWTFRRWCFYALTLHTGIWVILGLCLLRISQAPMSASMRSRLPSPRIALVMVALLVSCVLCPRFAYQAEKNICISWLLTPFRGGREGHHVLRQLASEFDQPLRPLSTVTGRRSGPLPVLPMPFSNVLFLVLDSVRYNGLGLDGAGDTPAPTLRRLASEGAHAKCYTSVPETIKGVVAILTGRYPYPGDEIREGVQQRLPSVLWSLREARSARTFCFTTQYLGFRNTYGILRACGIEACRGPRELQALARTTDPGRTGSSFGISDELLLRNPVKVLSEAQAPFAAVFLALAAHYPYNYPGKPASEGAVATSYWKSVAYTDSLVALLVEDFREAGLLADTLWVIVGDHGQSFGEHGVFFHGSSMYDEEVAVPLVLWSADGRLRHKTPLTCRQIDIAPTVAELMRVEDPTYQVQGHSLLSHGEPVVAYLSSFFPGVSAALIQGESKFIYRPSSGELSRFDLREDPGEAQPLCVQEIIRTEVIHRMKAFAAYEEILFPRE